ncbi:MAG: glycosyltransferase, partial [bacterium]
SPMISVIIPTYNRPKQLKACLAAVAGLEYPRDCFEVIVVDDGGEVALNKDMAEFKDQLDLTWLRQENAGPATARNTGAKNARGRFLAFTDDDCLPGPGWLQAYADQFAQTPDAMLGGRVLAQQPENLYAHASQLILDMVFEKYEMHPNQTHFFGAGNLAISADLFHRAGGFDGSFKVSEDREFCDRCLLQGIRLGYVPGAAVYHGHDLNLCRFWRQYFNYGRGAFQFHQKRMQRNSRSCTIDLGQHLNARHWLFQPFSRVKWQKAIPLAATLIVWQIANATGFAWEAMNKNKN